MRETGRAWKAELLKMRHSGCYPMHIAGAVLPAVAFLCYYASSNWSVILQVSGFFEAVGIAFPVVISILCAKSRTLSDVSWNDDAARVCVSGKVDGAFDTRFFRSVWCCRHFGGGGMVFLKKYGDSSGGLCGLGAPSLGRQHSAVCGASFFELKIFKGSLHGSGSDGKSGLGVVFNRTGGWHLAVCPGGFQRKGKHDVCYSGTLPGSGCLYKGAAVAERSHGWIDWGCRLCHNHGMVSFL